MILNKYLLLNIQDKLKQPYNTINLELSYSLNNGDNYYIDYYLNHNLNMINRYIMHENKYLFGKIKYLIFERCRAVYPDCEVQNNRIKIIFTDDKLINLIASEQCCDISWFELKNSKLSKLSGKRIISIEISKGFNNKLLPNVRDDYYKGLCNDVLTSKEIKIITDRGKPFIFYLRNKSNGFYDSFLQINDLK